MLLNTTLIAVSLLLTTAAQAETRYVTDQFKVAMRRGETTTHRIIQMIPSGTPLTILNRNTTSGYTHVRTASGKEGFILSRQLRSEPVARDKLNKLESRIQVLELAPGELSSKLAKLSREHEILTVEHKEVVNEKNIIEGELAALRQTSANTVQIAKERNQLQKQTSVMTRGLEDQKQEIHELKNDSFNRGVMIGGLLIIGGTLIGLILPHLKIKKRKDSWDSF